MCAGAPALHLFSESTTVWLCALTAVRPSHPFHLPVMVSPKN